MSIAQSCAAAGILLAVGLLGCSRDETPSPPATPADEPFVGNPPPVDPQSADIVSRRTEEYFAEWFKSHGENDVVVDANGVGLRSNPTRLKASLYESRKQQDGYVLELEFRIRLADGSEIVEYLGGAGETEEQAINDNILNFTLTTFHVIYKSFINGADPHVEMKPLTIHGQQRNVALGPIMMRGGDPNQNLDLNAMLPGIEHILEQLDLPAGPHWIKIVYSQDARSPRIVEVTLDNNIHEWLTRAIKGLDWPKQDSFYLAKQFIVIR